MGLQLERGTGAVHGKVGKAGSLVVPFLLSAPLPPLRGTLPRGFRLRLRLRPDKPHAGEGRNEEGCRKARQLGGRGRRVGLRRAAPRKLGAAVFLDAGYGRQYRCLV